MTTQGPKIGHYFGRVKVPMSYKEDTRLVLPKTDLGIEFEWEGVKTNQAVLDAQFGLLWEEHKEPSLHDNGREFAFRSPMYGEDVLNAITHMMSFANKEGWKTSMRTGLHVHQDVRDMTFQQLVGEVVFYTMFEPAIYAWCGDGRDANNFCAPWYKCEGSVYDAANLLNIMGSYTPDTNIFDPDENYTLASTAESLHKYAGLNLRPLKQYCSIEFRQMKATLDVSRVISWVNIILSLKKAALDSPESTMAIVGAATKVGLERELVRVFGESAFEQMLRASPTVAQDCAYIGVPNAIELIATLTQASTFRDNSSIYTGEDAAGAKRWLAKKDVAPERKQPGANKKFPPPPSPLHSLEAAIAYSSQYTFSGASPPVPSDDVLGLGQFDEDDIIEDDIIEEE